VSTPRSTFPAATLATMPVVGPMAVPFPEPGRIVRAAMEALQFAAMNPPESEGDLRRLASLPRPWDPATCTGRLREEVWAWLDEVAAWINQQHLWNVTHLGVPECWPAHPHLVHDLAVVASGRFYASYAVTPAALEEWHRYALPMFLDRVRERLGGGCQPGEHIATPRVERNRLHTAPAMRRRRGQRYRDDVRLTDQAAVESW
jgi:hypothetical protein